MMDLFLDGFMQGIIQLLGIIWGILMSNPIIFALFIVLFGGTFALGITVNVVRKIKLKKSGILEVDEMSGRVFEEYLQTLLAAKGYKVHLTPASGDYGADLIATQNDKKIAVQAKRYKKNVGVKAVQEVVSAKNYYDANTCWVVTNSYFTDQAKKLARSNHVVLINRKQLMEWMLQLKKGA